MLGMGVHTMEVENHILSSLGSNPKSSSTIHQLLSYRLNTNFLVFCCEYIFCRGKNRSAVIRTTRLSMSGDCSLLKLLDRIGRY